MRPSTPTLVVGHDGLGFHPDMAMLACWTALFAPSKLAGSLFRHGVGSRELSISGACSTGRMK
jgi:hypothetical protein